MAITIHRYSFESAAYLIHVSASSQKTRWELRNAGKRHASVRYICATRCGTNNRFCAATWDERPATVGFLPRWSNCACWVGK